MNNASLLKEWKKIFASFPVAVNNFYGDPLIQWSDTLKKLEYLTRQGHKGVVTVITKGVITNPMAERFRGFIKRGLKLLVCVSISELPQFEKVGMEHRYKNFSVLNNAGIRNLATLDSRMMVINLFICCSLIKNNYEYIIILVILYNKVTGSK